MAQVEFRDGYREVPDYLADLMASIETHRFTYDQAIEAANKKMADDAARTALEDVVRAHFAPVGQGR